jgi:acetylcholinesterase
VAVWIHGKLNISHEKTLLIKISKSGGGFFMGGAVDRRYNLSFIVENSVAIGKPIMAASIAYRLGPFGFLNGDAVAKEGATNLGLKDQRLGLQWIHENIAGFGGM